MKTNTSLSTVNCHWKKLLKLVSAVLLGAALLAPHPVAAQAATVEAIIHGAGTATDFEAGTSGFAVGVALRSDGSANGHFGARQFGGLDPGGFSAVVTSWSLETVTFPFIIDIVSLYAGPYTVRIFFFGGGGLVAWAVEDSLGMIVLEGTVLTGQIQIDFH